jgi:hypothetical protein
MPLAMNIKKMDKKLIDLMNVFVNMIPPKTNIAVQNTHILQIFKMYQHVGILSQSIKSTVMEFLSLDI